MVIFYVLVVGFWFGILGVSIKFFNGEGGFRGRYPQNLGQDFFIVHLLSQFGWGV